MAWVSGVATQGYFRNLKTGQVIGIDHLAGGTVVRDNGASENDPADQIRYSFFELDEPVAICTEKPDCLLFDVPRHWGNTWKTSLSARGFLARIILAAHSIELTCLVDECYIRIRLGSHRDHKMLILLL